MPKAILLLPLLLVSACSSLQLKVVNTGPGTITQVEIKTPASTVTAPELASGAAHAQELRLKSGGGISVNYLDSQGRQAYTSAPLELKAGDSGWVQLSITAQGLLQAADGRKGRP